MWTPRLTPVRRPGSAAPFLRQAGEPASPPGARYRFVNTVTAMNRILRSIEH